MPTALGNTARILRNLRLHAYKRTLIAFFLVEIVITFLFTVTVSGRNGLHSSPNLRHHPQTSIKTTDTRPSSSSNSSTEAPVTPDGLFPLSFFSESVSILNLPLNLVGMVLVSTEAVYFTLLYFPLRYFFTVALFRLVAAAPFAYCYPLMIDLLLVVVLHFYYVRLYNVKFFGRRSRGGDGDDQEFVIEEEETDNDSIFSVENHLHAAQLNAPPPSYTEVARNPLKYPSLVGVVEVGNSGGNASSSSAVLQLSPRRLESIEEVGEEAASAAAAAAAVEGQMTSTTLASTTTATTTRT
ncbi:hypothetical protein TYRP_010322 [Tyrophagus putrescentiae]|nr:hypothetical protein TYRP_010322 [Tyrophagus putrescentiae]